MYYYYYYYYGGGDRVSRVSYDVERVSSFLRDASDMIFALALDDRIGSGLVNIINEEERKDFDLKEWVYDVQTHVRVALRDINLALHTDSEREYWDILYESGLTGVQLQSKLNLWNEFYEKVMDWIKQGAKVVDSAFRTNLERAIEATNIILRSILAAIPGAEPLIELKDFLMLSVKVEADRNNSN